MRKDVWGETMTKRTLFHWSMEKTGENYICNKRKNCMCSGWNAKHISRRPYYGI